MIARFAVYKCEVCGNMVEVLEVGGGTLVCCGQPMSQLEEKTMDQGKEKHIPVVEKTSSGLKVKVGSVPHPMEKEHFIQWVEIITSQGNYRKFLSPGQAPEAEFCNCDADLEDVIAVREYCNVHGLWKKA